MLDLSKPPEGGFTASDMEAYAQEKIEEYKRKKAEHLPRGPKFTPAMVEDIRHLHQQGLTYKAVNKLYPMSEVTFISVIKRRGAYE